MALRSFSGKEAIVYTVKHLGYAESWLAVGVGNEGAIAQSAPIQISGW